MRRTLAALLLLGALVGCGGSDTPSAAAIASQLRDAVKHDDHGSSLTGVQCVQRAERSFRCVGDYHPTRASVRTAMSGIDTSAFGASDWDALVKQRSGSVAFDVDVAKDGSSFVYTPSS